MYLKYVNIRLGGSQNQGQILQIHIMHDTSTNSKYYIGMYKHNKYKPGFIYKFLVTLKQSHLIF